MIYCDNTLLKIEDWLNKNIVSSKKRNIDVFDVINAASTKNFGFQRFLPGPGWGGHCIPIDPFYLTWKAKKIGVSGNKWDFWVKLQQLKRWNDIDKEALDIITEMSEEESPFDMSVANAIANENRKQFRKDAGS